MNEGEETTAQTEAITVDPSKEESPWTTTGNPEGDTPTTTMFTPDGVSVVPKDTELQAGNTLDEKRDAAAAAEPIPMGQILEDLQGFGVDEKSIAMLVKRLNPDSESPLNEDEIAQLRQAHHIHQLTQEITASLPEELQEKINALANPGEDGEEAPTLTEEDIAQLNDTLGEEKVNEIAAKFLAAGEMLAGSFMGWLSESTQRNNMSTFISFVLGAAGFNSGGSMRRAYEAEGAKQLSADAFFLEFARNPKESMAKMIEAEDDLGKELNWKSDILRKAAEKKPLTNEDGQIALKEYFLEMYAAMESSSAKNVLWESASKIINKKVFGGEFVIDPKILTMLEEMKDDPRLAKNKFTNTG